jgi:hypothetical protein
VSQCDRKDLGRDMFVYSQDRAIDLTMIELNIDRPLHFNVKCHQFDV